MKVLCAVDGSEFSRWGVEALRSLVLQRVDTVILLHVADTTALKRTTAEGRAHLKTSLAAITAEGSALLHRMAQAASVALSELATTFRPKIRTVLTQGPVAERIVKEATRRRVDLVIVGSRGLSDIREFLLGSVSRKVVALAACPVLVVKRRLPEIGLVVLAIDGSKYSRAAAGFLRAHLLPDVARLSVVSVVPPVVTDLAARVLPAAQLDSLTKPEEDRARDLVATARESFLKEGCAVTAEVLTGHPSHVIISYAEKQRAELVVVGSRGLTGQDRFLLGSVSESVVKHAPCSVLVVRGKTG